jgi:hypothetical protein
MFWSSKNAEIKGKRVLYYARIFWSTSWVEFEGKEGELEYFCRVGTQNLGNRGALEYFGQLVT